jgi:transcriptional regulator with XRE-family HTH domain
MAAKQPGRPTHATKEAPQEMHVLFGANFKQARLKAKLSQTEVAARTNIGQPYISEIENGVRDITLGTMTTLAKAVGTDVRALLKPPPKRK